MSGSLGSGIVNPDSQPPSPWSQVLPPPPPPPPASPPAAAVSAPAAARRAALSPGDVTGGGLPRTPPVESGGRPALSRAGAPRRRAALLPNAVLAGLRRRARTAHGPVVLTIAVDPVRHLLVDRDVIHLADRQRDVRERPPMIPRDARAAVARLGPVIRVLRIHPDIVTVAAAAVGDREREAAVHRTVEACCSR